MGSVISVCNLKGGAGKSTIAVNLACAIHDLTGARCTLVDADRQGTSDAWAAQGKLPVRVLKKCSRRPSRKIAIRACCGSFR